MRAWKCEKKGWKLRNCHKCWESRPSWKATLKYNKVQTNKQMQKSLESVLNIEKMHKYWAKKRKRVTCLERMQKDWKSMLKIAKTVSAAQMLFGNTTERFYTVCFRDLTKLNLPMVVQF